MTLHLLTVVGARPQFVKAAAITRAVARHNQTQPEVPIAERLVHTGQHYDPALSASFFAELGLPEPAHHLEVGSAPHGAQTGRMLERVEAVLLDERPDLVLVHGDTNSTLAGALAASKLHIPVAHVEAGLRSFNRRMAEETNRILTDRLSRWLFCPTPGAVAQLAQEGLDDGVHQVGDVMHDIFRERLPDARADPAPLRAHGLEPAGYALVTAHRAENTDDPARLAALIEGLRRLGQTLPVVLPLHPRTRAAVAAQGLSLEGLQVLPPLPYGAMLALEANARVILTDSGGVQKEAYWAGVPCLTLRDETEWPETVAAGWNTLVGCDAARIARLGRDPVRPAERPALFGDGRAADAIVAVLAREGRLAV